MPSRLQTLLSIGSEALGRPINRRQLKFDPTESSDMLYEVLSQKNGFFAFESALTVFPLGLSDKCYDLEFWNRVETWKDGYDLFPSNCICFAEDIFGMQFCLMDTDVYLFDPETEGFTKVSDDIEGWADRVLSEYHSLTGYPFAHEWQKANGPIKSKCRLVPVIPFVCGGEFDLDNVREIDSVRGMKYRAEIARQIRDLPDGATIQLKPIS